MKSLAFALTESPWVSERLHHLGGWGVRACECSDSAKCGPPKRKSRSPWSSAKRLSGMSLIAGLSWLP